MGVVFRYIETTVYEIEISFLGKRTYDKSVAYYILYVAYFYMMLGNKERCMFFFSKFEKYDVDVKNWTVPVQQIYAELQQFLL